MNLKSTSKEILKFIFRQLVATALKLAGISVFFGIMYLIIHFLNKGE
jgi:hypothetical protein